MSKQGLNIIGRRLNIWSMLRDTTRKRRSTTRPVPIRRLHTTRTRRPAVPSMPGQHAEEGGKSHLDITGGSSSQHRLRHRNLQENKRSGTGRRSERIRERLETEGPHGPSIFSRSISVKGRIVLVSSSGRPAPAPSRSGSRFRTQNRASPRGISATSSNRSTPPRRTGWA
jgi:hypothetical protein